MTDNLFEAHLLPRRRSGDVEVFRMLLFTPDGDPLDISPSEQSGHTIEDEGTPLTDRSVLNFVGEGVTVTDASGKTTVTIPGSNSATIPFAAIESDLPNSPEDGTHPIYLVLDSDGEGTMQLYAWSGIEWRTLSGGEVENGDFIIISYDNAFAIGDILIWDGTQFNTEEQ